MRIYVGSDNPVKIKAAQKAIHFRWPRALITGFEVASGVSKQPRTDQETKQGAINRAKAALAQGLAQQKSRGKQTTLGVGLEGGVFSEGKELWSTVWAAVVDEAGHVFTANGARVQLPPEMADPIRAGGEMGPVVAELIGQADVRSKQGMVGVLTNNFVDRTTEYATIARLAVGLWYGQDWLKTNTIMKVE